MQSTVATHICIPTFSVQTVCMLQDDPAFGVNLVAHDQVCRKICCLSVENSLYSAGRSQIGR